MTATAVPREFLLAEINRLQQQEESTWGAHGHQGVDLEQERLVTKSEREIQPKPRPRSRWCVWSRR